MTRFAKALVGTALPLALLAALLVVVIGLPRQSPTEGRAGTSAQVEDESSVEDEATETTTSSTLANVVQLVDILSPGDEERGAVAGERQIFLTRDPFDPVVIETTGDGGTTNGDSNGNGDGGGDGNGDGDGDGDGDGGGDGDGDGNGNGDGSEPCTGDENEQVCEGRVVTLESVNDQEALVVVDGSTFSVGVDDEFATSFRVLSLDPPCATMLYGDEAFTVCTGVTVLK